MNKSYLAVMQPEETIFFFIINAFGASFLEAFHTLGF